MSKTTTPLTYSAIPALESLSSSRAADSLAGGRDQTDVFGTAKSVIRPLYFWRGRGRDQICSYCYKVNGGIFVIFKFTG